MNRPSEQEQKTQPQQGFKAKPAIFFTDKSACLKTHNKPE
jgi:hypothetical protein